MTDAEFAPRLQRMIDRAGRLTAAEAETLGRLWEAQEDIQLPKPSLQLELQGEVDWPVVTNEQLVDAWQRTLDAAGSAGRVDEIEAARAAGRATHSDDRRLHDHADAKVGAEEAVRSAVLAVGLQDLIPDADFRILTSCWERVLGAP